MSWNDVVLARMCSSWLSCRTKKGLNNAFVMDGGQVRAQFQPGMYKPADQPHISDNNTICGYVSFSEVDVHRHRDGKL